MQVPFELTKKSRKLNVTALECDSSPYAYNREALAHISGFIVVAATAGKFQMQNTRFGQLQQDMRLQAVYPKLAQLG
jgi:hypothetical protein